jgi:proline iminopeptidase
MRVASRFTMTVVVILAAASSACASLRDVHRARSGSMQVDGAPFRWVREGRGPAVFVLGSSVYYPKAFSAGLRNYFELVFVDGRHFVPSYAPDPETLSKIDLAKFADDVEAMRRTLGYERIVIVGHSIHGQIALEYAARFPASTARVVLIAAVPYAFGEFASAAAAIWDTLATEERKTLLAERTNDLRAVLAAHPPNRSFAVSYDRRAPLYWADPGYDATQLLEGLENGPAFARLAASLPTRSQARARLERINAPILLVLGKLDFAIPYTAWEELIRGLDNVDYVLLEMDSHNPQTESPARFDPVMINWARRR